MDESKRRIAVIDGEIKVLETERKLLLDEMQAFCTHSGNVVESPSGFTSEEATLRLCLVCGMVMSDSWGSFGRLNHDIVNKLSLDEFCENLSSAEIQFWRG